MKSSSARFPTPPTKPEQVVNWAVRITNALYELAQMVRRETHIIEYGLDVDKPTPVNSGKLYWATDTEKMYYDPPT
jgi:hypothetical protein